MKQANGLLTYRRYQYKWVLLIAICWTLIEASRGFILASSRNDEHYPFITLSVPLVLSKVCLFFLFSLVMVYLLLFQLRRLFRNTALWLGNLGKAFILCLGIAVTSMLILLFCYVFIYQYPVSYAVNRLMFYSIKTSWLLDTVLFWILVFIPTQLLVEINEKYSPGVFSEIFFGKYVQPKEEERIIMFIDLKDSTPIAEQLGHKLYFLFIRDFIHFVSAAILEYNGRIYQYVGDEIVVSWQIGKDSDRDRRASIQALISARKLLQQENDHFRQKYNIIPEFRVGMHAGKVMVGEIGLIKKDLAMSGDAMNTAARIRSATGELKHRFIMSKDFVDRIDLEQYQAKSLGMVDLKGKEGSIELFSLHI